MPVSPSYGEALHTDLRHIYRCKGSALADSKPFAAREGP